MTRSCENLVWTVYTFGCCRSRRILLEKRSRKEHLIDNRHWDYCYFFNLVSIGVECDVFAAGMTFWEILSRQHCWPQDEPFFVTLVQQVHKQRRPAPLDASLPAFLQPLLERSVSFAHFSPRMVWTGAWTVCWNKECWAGVAPTLRRAADPTTATLNGSLALTVFLACA